MFGEDVEAPLELGFDWETPEILLEYAHASSPLARTIGHASFHASHGIRSFAAGDVANCELPPGNHPDQGTKGKIRHAERHSAQAGGNDTGPGRPLIGNHRPFGSGNL